MPSLGPLEILTVLVVALVVFGPTRLPEIARTVGKTLAELRRAANDLRSEFEAGAGLDLDEDDAEAPRTEEVRAGERDSPPAGDGAFAADEDVQTIPDVPASRTRAEDSKEG